MISWMQRHRKYLVVTIWISTIAFIGAGFVGWGQYSYGDKASAVAKVGSVDITARELQTAYSSLYNQYSRLFQGNFDESQAKSLGLDKMALKQLVEQALILNLAHTYGLVVTDEELMKSITSQEVFFKDGSFDKENYLTLLKQNGLNSRDYEADMRKNMLIRKTLSLFPQQANPIEGEVLSALTNIADKIDFKVLDAGMITLDTGDDALKAFWEGRKLNYMTEPVYIVEAVTQEPVSAEADEAAMREFYESKRSEFTDADGKILEFDAAKEAVRAAMDAKATNRAALRQALAFKKGTLDDGTAVARLELVESAQPYSAELFGKIKALSPADPYLKAEAVGDTYMSFKLIEVKPSEPMDFETAKAQVRSDYLAEEKAVKLQELAESSVATFEGETSPYITRNTTQSFKGLNAEQSKQFVDALFAQQKRRGFITLDNETVVLFHILEQKMLKTPQTDLADSAMRLKSTLLDQGLIAMLERSYPVEIYMEGY